MFWGISKYRIAGYNNRFHIVSWRSIRFTPLMLMHTSIAESIEARRPVVQFWRWNGSDAWFSSGTVRAQRADGKPHAAVRQPGRLAVVQPRAPGQIELTHGRQPAAQSRTLSHGLRMSQSVRNAGGKHFTCTNTRAEQLDWRLVHSAESLHNTFSKYVQGLYIMHQTASSKTHYIDLYYIRKHLNIFQS